MVPHRLGLSLASALALLALVLGAPAAARADGDPASDVLVTENVFLPFVPPVSPALTSALDRTIRRAHAAGFPIKVAVIEGRADLGALPELFGAPQKYASFLDQEITYDSTPKLLVVMPQGFGTADAGSTRLLAGIHVDAAEKSNGLVRAAIQAIVALAAGARHPIPAPRLPESNAGGGGTELLWVVALVAAAILGAGALVARRKLTGQAPHRDEANA